MTKSATKKRERAARREAAKAVHSPGNDPADDPIPDDIAEFRHALAQRMDRFVGTSTGAFRRCRLPLCRRARACRGNACVPAPRPTTEAEDARTKALMYRALKRAIEEGLLREDDDAADSEAAAGGPRKPRARR